MSVGARQLFVKIKVASVNEHILCRLCGGYIVEATAIAECLHSCKLLGYGVKSLNRIIVCHVPVCRSCIVKHVKKPGRTQCPTCHVHIEEGRPVTGLRY
jgi:hypothetical protein